ncbi:MAG: endonuclease/exonuclease/phosphatase family protein [Phycisphaerales bacterium]
MSEREGPNRSTARVRVWQSVGRIAGVFAALCAACASLRFVTGSYPYDLLSHFQLQYLLAGSLLVVITTLARVRWAIVAAIICVIGPATAIVPRLGIVSSMGSSATDANASTLRIYHANVLTDNTSYARALADIASHDPDIIILQETDDRWMQGVAALRDTHPHIVAQPRGDNFGMAVYSRLAISQHTVADLGASGVPTIIFQVMFDDRVVEIIGTHPLPPLQRPTAELRDRQLAALAEHLRNRDERARIVIGDLNVTPFSPHFKQLVARATAMHDGRLGQGLLPTWPAEYPWFMRIPIDHCLVSDELEVMHLTTGADIGSDHLPLIVDVALRSQ